MRKTIRNTVADSVKNLIYARSFGSAIKRALSFYKKKELYEK
jgi:hypothetical protein